MKQENIIQTKSFQKSNYIILDYSEYLIDIEEIINILTAIVKTSQSGN